MTKVGISQDPRVRMQSLSRLVPVTLRLTYAVDGDRALESALHRLLTARDQHVYREWFKPITASEAKNLTREAIQHRADSTLGGRLKLFDVGEFRVERARRYENGSIDQNRELDAATKVAKRLELTESGKRAAELLHASILVVRLGYRPPQRHRDESTASQTFESDLAPLPADCGVWADSPAGLALLD